MEISHVSGPFVVCSLVYARGWSAGASERACERKNRNEIMSTRTNCYQEFATDSHVYVY